MFHLTVKTAISSIMQHPTVTISQSCSCYITNNFCSTNKQLLKLELLMFPSVNVSVVHLNK